MMLYFARVRRAGFTLIEIMIVIAIIAILAGIAIPNFREARAEAKLVECRQGMMAIANALEMAAMRCGYMELVKNKMGGYNSSGLWMISSDDKVYAYLVDYGYLKKKVYCPVSGELIRCAVYAGGAQNGKALGSGFYLECGLNGVCHHIIGNKRIKPVYANLNNWGYKCGWNDKVKAL